MKYVGQRLFYEERENTSSFLRAPQNGRMISITVTDSEHIHTQVQGSNSNKNGKNATEHGE